MRRAELSGALADAFLAGAWTERSLAARGARAVDRRPRWLLGVVRAVLAVYHRPPLDRPRELARFVGQALPDEIGPLRVVRRYAVAPATVRRPFAGTPRLDGVEDVAAFLGHDLDRLLWLADARSLERSASDERLRNYRYLWRERADGRLRLLEAPKPMLRAAQRRILDELLVHVPPHDAAHGFVAGRSVLTHARAHAARRVVIGMDLEDFFAAIDAQRIFAIHRAIGFPEPVAHTLCALATNAVPASFLRTIPQRLRRRLATPHLPQGAPTSPALANLAAFALDRRLTAVAATFGATYTRYADDLAFSGGAGVLRRARALRAAVAEVVAEERFTLNPAKSHLTTDAGRQTVCGIVVNVHPNVQRSEYDRLRAQLHAAALDGPGSLDRDRVLGRVAWVAHLNPGRGARLRELLERVRWDRD